MYRNDTTDPITGRALKQRVNMRYVIEKNERDSLVTYFESQHNRDLYLQNPDRHRLDHQGSSPS